MAQTTAPKPEEGQETLKLEKFEVTGSRLTGAAVEGSLSVSTYKLDDLQNSGYSNFGEMLRRKLPQFGGGTGTINEGFGNGGSGAATISLRGLPLSATLFLVNGRRTNADMNLIPAVGVERIEVLNDGASAIYGSDAVAGVINVILKRNYEGAMLTTRYANTTDTDVGEFKAGLVAGGQMGKTSLTLAVEHSTRNTLFHKDRAVSLPSGDSVSGASNPGLFTPVATQAQRVAANATVAGDPGHTAGVTNVNALVPLRWFVNTSGAAITNAAGLGQPGFNPAVFLTLPTTMSITARNAARDAEEIRLNGLMASTSNVRYGLNKVLLPGINPGMPFGYFTYGFRPQEATNISLTTDTQISDNLRFYADVLLARNESVNALAASPLSSSTTARPLTATNYWVQQVFPGNANVYGFGYRPLELGPRLTFNRFEDITLTAGFEGKLDKWTWNLAYLRDEWKSYSLQTGGVSASVYAAALAGTTATSAWNPFTFTPLFDTTNPLPSNQTLVNSFKRSAFTTNRALTDQVEASISGEIMEISGGAVGAAFGAEYRREKIDLLPNLDIQQGTIFPFNTATPFKGDREIKSVYAEVNVPIIKSFSVSAAGRIEEFSDVGRTDVKPRVSFRWNPLGDELTVRGSWAQGFVAPSLTALDAGSPSQSFTELFNPVTGIRTQATGASIFIGNPGLLPSESDSYLFGVVYSPKAVKGLTVGMNYYRIEQTNIPFSSDQYIVNEWFAAGPTNPNNPYGPTAAPSAQNPLGAQVSLNPDGSLQQVRNVGPINTGARNTDGLDFFANYVIKNSLGTWTWDASFTKVLTFEMENFPGAGMIDYLDGYWPGGSALGNYGFPIWKGSTSITWKKDVYVASINYNHVDGYKEIGNANKRIPAYATMDIRFGYTIPGVDVQVSAGMNNVFDEQPPFVSTSFESQSDRAITDLRGRMFFVELSKKF
ncbi:MAG: TonB-dependent receptor [Candidatus Didemnitutus sp.]|nr:TonB-dependent receptor [Candidatus Didemnitutus sp.]